MSKFSVKKPLTVFVAVIAVIALGVVSYLNMTPDLFPNMDFPYVVLVTAYPGANPEKVEAEVTKPLEQSMATLDRIKEITSTSAENYSMVMLEFEEGVNLDTVGVDIQQSIVALTGSWDAMVQTPFVLKINPSMLPVMVAAVSKDGMDTMALTEYLNESLLSKLEGVPGVARISTAGTVTQQLHVVLSQDLIDTLNEKIRDAVNKKMDDALAELTGAKSDLESAQTQMEAAEKQLTDGKAELAEQTAAGETEIQKQLAELRATKTQLENTLSVLKAVQSGLDTLEKQLGEQEAKLDALKELKARKEQIDARQKAMDEKIAAIKNSGKPQEEIDAELAALMASEEYLQLEADKAQLEADMKAQGVTALTLDARIAITEAAILELQKAVDQLLQDLKEQGVDLTELDATVETMEAGLKELEAAITMLLDAQQALSKTQMQTLLQLADAGTQLAVNKASVTAALTQVESGIKTLEDTRAKTLAQSDLTKIITMDMVSSILTAQNFAMPAGTVEQDGVSYMVSVGEELTQTEQLEELLLFDLGMEEIEPVYLKDVAAVMVTDNHETSYAKLDGLDAVMLTFEKQSTYATAETTDNLLARFRQLEAEIPGLRFVSLMNQGDYIYLIVETILGSLLLGALFSVIVLLLFLKDLRPTFITLCSIPISVIFAIVLMYFSGVTINMISLSGLAVSVGMLVDNSVVVIENIYRLRSKGANVIQAAVSGAGQVAGAIIASTLTTVCVFLPIVFVKGITKQLFTDLALTMTYALMASLIVAMTLVPAMASGLLKKEKEFKSPLMDRFLRLYEKCASWSLDHKAIVLIGATVLLVASAVFSVSRGFIFMPEMDMPSVTVNISIPEDATPVKAAEMADEVLNRIATIEGVQTVGAMQASSLDLTGSGQDEGIGNITVYVTLEDDTASGAAVGRKIDELCADMECRVSSSSEMLDMSMLTGAGISLRIYGNDMQLLQDAAQQAADALAKIPGITETNNGLGEQTPALHIDVDRNKAMEQGITVAQIYMELAGALKNTNTVTTLQLEGTSTELIVKKPTGAVLTVEDLEQYPFSVTTQTGETKEFILSDVATVENTTSLASISRIDQRRYITVSATLAEGENVTLKTNEAERAMRSLKLGDGITYAFTGENETIMESMEQLVLMLAMGVLLVYLVMVAQFQSLKSPFIVMFTIPLAFTGGFAALVICGLELSVISMIGFVMLTGIIVNNGIVLVDYINQLRAEGVERRQAILEAGKTRMRPILMTTITTVLGLMDMAVRKSAGTTLMQPVAIVCIGGLVYATIMTLFIVPIIYDMMNKKELRVVNDQDLEILDL